MGWSLEVPGAAPEAPGGGVALGGGPEPGGGGAPVGAKRMSGRG